MVRFKLILSTVPSDNELNQHALWICTEWDTHTDTHTSDIYGDTGGKDKVWHWLFMSRSPQNQKLSLCHSSTISLSSKFLSPGVSKVTKQLKVTKLIYLSLVCSVHCISFLTKISKVRFRNKVITAVCIVFFLASGGYKCGRVETEWTELKATCLLTVSRT